MRLVDWLHIEPPGRMAHHYRTTDMKYQAWFIALAAALGAASLMPACAQDYPAKPIRIIVPYPAGGSADAVTRLLAPQLGERWKQPLIVDNRPGAGSITGTKLLTEAPADGYTLGIVANGLTLNPSIHPKMPFDTARDLKPVTQLTFTPNVLVASPDSSIKSLAQLVQQAKAAPGKFSSGSIGNGTASHLALERLKAAAGIDILHAPFQGAAPGVTAVLGGHTDLMMANLPDVLPYIRAGKLTALGIASAQRMASAPEIPTFVEQGYAQFVSGAWYGVAVRSDTPEKIVRKLNADLVAAINRPETRKQLTAMGLEPVGSSLADFDRLVRSELNSNAELVKRAGIHLD
jgi:tripartite-type tricarboxylate transporter receptor subunit TctC